jgi:hypothetical protein
VDVNPNNDVSAKERAGKVAFSEFPWNDKKELERVKYK